MWKDNFHVPVAFGLAGIKFFSTEKSAVWKHFKLVSNTESNKAGYVKLGSDKMQEECKNNESSVLH